MLQQQINDQIKDAMMKKETVRLDVLRGIKTSMTNELVATGRTPQDTLTDEQVIAVISRISKQRKDSIEQFKKGGREDLVDAEEHELSYITPLLWLLCRKKKLKRLWRPKKQNLV